MYLIREAVKWPAATAIHDSPTQSKIRIDYTWTDPTSGKTGTGIAPCDFCISTMAPNLLATIPTSLPQWFRAALAAVTQTPAIKAGWQARTRFWESENNIYGGISWTDDTIGQIWYPSDDVTAHTGVLTGAYNRGPPASVFGQYSQSQRLQATRLAAGPPTRRRSNPRYIARSPHCRRAASTSRATPGATCRVGRRAR